MIIFSSNARLRIFVNSRKWLRSKWKRKLTKTILNNKVKVLAYSFLREKRKTIMVTWKGENSPVTSKGCKHDFPSVISLLKRLIIYPDITNKGQHVTKDNCVTDQQESKSFNSVTTEQLPSSQLIINANADTIDTFTDPHNRKSSYILPLRVHPFI